MSESLLHVLHRASVSLTSYVHRTRTAHGRHK